MSERPNAVFSDEILSRLSQILPWKDYPIGTKAVAIGGGHWIKTEHGWKWGKHGSTFPTPGADAGWVILP